MKTKKVLNIKPQEVCEGDEHYVRYKGCDGRMHELPTHTVTHNERVKEMFITNPEARAVFQASFPNAIEVKDIQVAGCFLRDDSQQSELRFDAPIMGVPQKRFPHYYAIDSQGTIRFISNGEPVDQSSLSLAEDHDLPANAGQHRRGNHPQAVDVLRGPHHQAGLQLLVHHGREAPVRHRQEQADLRRGRSRPRLGR